MPRTKLTLSADSDLVRQAKQLTREQGTSLSALFDRFIRSLLVQQESGEVMGPLSAQALGLLRLPEHKSDQELLTEALDGRARGT